MHSILGGLRPTRDTSGDQPFVWVDGPLVKAMEEGSVFLIDEISLAEDGVLERLNSVLESERNLYLMEQSNLREDIKGMYTEFFCYLFSFFKMLQVKYFFLPLVD